MRHCPTAISVCNIFHCAVLRRDNVFGLVEKITLNRTGVIRLRTGRAGSLLNSPGLTVGKIILVGILPPYNFFRQKHHRSFFIIAHYNNT